MRLNLDVRGDAKKCTSDYAMTTPLAYARIYLEPLETRRITVIQKKSHLFALVFQILLIKVKRDMFSIPFNKIYFQTPPKKIFI